MDHPLNLASVVRAMAHEAGLRARYQITDRASPDLGALVRPEWGLASPTNTIAHTVSCGLLHLADAADGSDGPSWLERADLAIDYLLRNQRPSGNIDLLSTNWDSSPDTGFAVGRLCPLIELGRELAPGDAEWRAFQSKVETFVRRAAIGVRNGGFHTPNHRWVMASALAYAAHLLPGLDAGDAIQAYLAEGFDLDPDGAFIERSSGVYDAVCDRSLLMLHEFVQAPGALEAVLANLDWNLHMLHADGTVETGLSRRQDYGTRVVPSTLGPSYLWAGRLTGDDRLLGAARFLWDRALAPHEDELNWLFYLLKTQGGLPDDEGQTAPSDRYSRLYSHNGIWRHRRGELSISVFRDVTRLLTLTYGSAEMASCKIAQPYFGVGRFIAEEMAPKDEGGVILRSSGRQRLHKPGYEHPLGRPVSPEHWLAEIANRKWRPLPPCESTLLVEPVESGIRLRYRTLDGLDGVMAQIALDFAPGATWETADTATTTRAGQIIFLKGGRGEMRYGSDVIRIEPGADAHRMWEMRNTEGAPDHVRVILAFLTPVDHAFTITCKRQAGPRIQ